MKAAAGASADGADGEGDADGADGATPKSQNGNSWKTRPGRSPVKSKQKRKATLITPSKGATPSKSGRKIVNKRAKTSPGTPSSLSAKSDHTPKRCAFHSCDDHMRVSHACLTCASHMCVSHVCLICVSHMRVSYYSLHRCFSTPPCL